MPTTYDPGALPGPLGSDPADGPAQIGALAQRIAAFKDGLTTAQRNALTGDDLWDGRRIWNTETQRVEVYNAATPGWAPVGVTDHAALSNLTTGDPHTQYVRKALATAKGDLLVATASGVITRKAVGANGRVLTADSAQSDGLAWTDLSATYARKVDNDRIVLGAADLAAINGSPTLSTAHTLYPGWLLDATAFAEDVGGHITVPDDWVTVDIYFWWSNAGAGAGDVVLRAFAATYTDGGTISAAGSTGTETTATAPADTTFKRTLVRSAFGVTASRVFQMGAGRRGSHAADTLANDIIVFAVEIVKAS